VVDEGNASKPSCIEKYNSNMSSVGMSDMIANNYSYFPEHMKLDKKMFFHPVDLTVLTLMLEYACFVNDL
jgi:hypothetical protein